MSLNSENKSEPLEIETITILKGKNLLHCSSGSHVYDKYSPAPLMWLQGKENIFTGSKLNKPSNTNNVNIRKENSWYCKINPKEAAYNVFYFYKTRRPLRLFKGSDFAILAYLKDNHPELFDKLPFDMYPYDYVMPMILSQLYKYTFDGIYHWDGHIILWEPYEEKLEFLRKEYNESLNPLKPWILPNRGPGTKYYMPTEAIIDEVYDILRPHMKNIDGRRNKTRKNKTRKNRKNRRTNRNMAKRADA